MKKDIKLLYLEDDVLDFELVKNKLISDPSFNFDISMVSNKDEFKNILKQESFDIILSDYNLQGFTGLDALQHLVDINSLCPFVLLSGAVGDELAVEIMKQGAFDYVLKDKLEKLPLIIERAIDSATQKQERLKWESMFHTIEKAAFAGFFQLDKQGKLTYSNKYFQKIFGSYNVKFANREWWQIFDKSEADKLKTHWNKFLKKSNVFEISNEFKTRKGSNKWLDIKISPEIIGKEVVGYVGLVFDISHIKKTEQQLEFIKKFDPLTLLPNKSSLEAMLVAKISQKKGKFEQYFLLFTNIDNFKRLNESLGHKVGDEVLISVASVISKHFGKKAIVSRFDNDTFAILLSSFKNQDLVIELIQKLSIKFSKKPITVDGENFYLTLTTGVVNIKNKNTLPKEVFQYCSIALHQAKARARGKYVFYSSEISDKVNRSLALEHALYYGLANNEIYLAYQPQIHIGENKITGVEALCRWHSESIGMVSPGELIPLAESSGLIMPLTKYLCKRFFADIEKFILQKNNTPNRFIFSFNLSAKLITENDFLNFIIDEFKKHKIPSQNICFEVTETAIMYNFESAKLFLNKLTSLGFSFSIDDFGTGQSSLSYLKNLPVCELKVDGSFVRHIATSQSDKKIVRAIVNLAKDLNLKVLAECVEDKEQLKVLQKINCEYVQGYYYSKPLKLEDMMTYVDSFVLRGEQNE